MDESERRFIVEEDSISIGVEEDSISIGVVELLEINFIHRTCEVLIIIDPQYANRGYAKKHSKWQLIMRF